MPLESHIMGLFRDENSVVAAINALKESSFKFIRVNTPFPSHKIMNALKLKKSMVGWFTLCGGILGFIGDDRRAGDRPAVAADPGRFHCYALGFNCQRQADHCLGSICNRWF